MASPTRIKLGLLVLGVLVLAVAAGVLTTGQATPAPTSQRSTYNPGPAGLKALYKVLQSIEMGSPERLKSIRGLSARRGVLVVAGPLNRELTETQADLIWSWVRRGNGLLYMVGLEASERAPSALDQRAFAGKIPEALPAGYPRFTRKALSSAIVPAFQPAPMILTTLPLRPTSPYPLAGTQIYGSAYGPTVTWLPVGEGNVIICAKSTPAQNRYIDRIYNLDFMLCALEFLRPSDGEILFDELHHGFPEKPRVLGLITVRGILAAAFEVLACGLLYVMVQGRRQGPPVGPEPEPRRGTAEYLDAAGALYRRTCDPGEIVASYASAVAHQASQQRGLGRPIEPAHLAPLLAKWSALSSEEIQNLLQRARNAPETGVSREEATEMIRHLSELVKTVRPSGEARLREKMHAQEFPITEEETSHG
jgi:hypothetical protein